MKNSPQTQEELWAKLKQPTRSKALLKSESRVVQLNSRIEDQILCGSTVLSHQRQVKTSKKYEEEKRKKQIEKIQQQKDLLYSKIEKINKSLDIIQIEKSSRNHKTSLKRGELFSMTESRIKEHSWRKKMVERTKRIQQKKLLLQQREKSKLHESQASILKSKQNQEKLKKKQLSQRVKMIQERSKQRFAQIQQSKQTILNLKKKKKLFQAFSASYQTQQTIELQKKKQHLRQIRNLHKPLDHEELLKHEEKFLEILKLRQQQRQKEREMLQEKARSYKAPYQSVYYKRVLAYDLQQSRHISPNSKDRVKQYAEKVKKTYVPTIDESKRSFFSDIKNKEKFGQDKYEREKELQERLKQKGKENIEFLRKLPKKKRDDIKPPSEPQKPRYQNYLTHSHITEQKAWQKVLRSQKSNEDKISNLTMECEKLQQKKKQKKRINKVLKQVDNDQMDEEYFSIVRAKLQLLDSQL